MNYDKWNKMNLGGEDEEVGADVATEVNRLKAKADAIFEANENSGRSMPVSYKECIGIYEQITQMVSAYATHLDLSIRCHLNLACCFIRESEWLLAIKHGRTAQKLCTEENWNEKLRAIYFELHALCNYFHNLDHAGRLSHHALLIEADKHVIEMKKTLQFHAGFVTPEHLSDYEGVFHQLAQCLAKVEKDNEGMAESHFEKAQQLQRMHQDQEAVAELVLCTQLTLQLRSMHQASKAAKINILIALIFAHRRDFSSALQYYTTAHTIISNDGASSKDPVLLAVIATSMSVCALKLKQVSPSTAGDLFHAVCALAQCVFDNPNTPADDVNVAFLAHLLTPNAHIIDKTALGAHHSPHTTTTAEYIHAQHLLRACNVLADLHAAQEEWEKCNDVTDHTIDICNALIAQFAPATGAATPTTASVAPPIVAVLQRRRAECFVAKAMLYKDHPLLIARPPLSSEIATPATSAAATATDNNTTTYTWPSCIPLLTKHSVPTEYNEYATFHRLHFDSVSEAVAVLLQVAGSEYEKIDAVQSMRTFHTLAEYTMQIAQIQPFVFSDAASTASPVRSSANTSKNATAFTTTSYAGEIITTTTTAAPSPPSTVSSTNNNAVDKKDLAEKAADAWAKVSLQATRQVDAIQAALASLTAPTASSGDSNSTAPYVILRTHYFEKYFYLQQSMLALYYAGVCAFHFDLTLSQRNLESAEEVQKSIDALLTGELRSEFNLGEPGSSSPDSAIAGDATGENTNSSASAEDKKGPTNTNTTANSAESRSLHGYYATCGDLSYHLSQAYLRLAMYTEALQAATSALAYYEHSERLLYLLNTINQYNNSTVGNNNSSPRTPISPATLKNTKSYHSLLKMGVVGLVIPLAETTPTGRLRQRLCLTVCALSHSARGELKLVEQAVRRVGDLCLGPIEDATVEVSAVRRQLSQQQHSIQQEMNATSHIHNSRNDNTAQARTSNRSDSPAPVSAAIAIDGNKVSNSVVDFDSDENVHSGARFTNDDKPKKNVNTGISNLRVEKVPTDGNKHCVAYKVYFETDFLFSTADYYSLDPDKALTIHRLRSVLASNEHFTSRYLPAFIMQNDDVIWQIINHQFCSFKTKIAKERTFCQHPYNVTGLCIRSACPLANSRYATIREEEGDCYLFIKTIERAHTPKNLWEKIKLPSNYVKALELVSNELEHFPKYLVHRNKQRLTKIHQMLIRMRKLKLKATPKIVTTNTKIEQREKGKERKALAAAQLDRAIEKELLERLRQATEGEIFNYPEKEFGRALTNASKKFRKETGEEEVDVDYEGESEEEEEGEEELEGEDAEQEMEEEEEEDEEDEKEYNVEYIEDFEESDDEGEGSDMEDQSFSGSLPSRGSLSTKGSMKGSSSNGLPLKSSLRSASSADDSKKRKLAFESTTKPGSKAASSKAPAARSNKARVEVEYEMEEEGERVPAQLRILAAQAAQANSRGGGGGGRSTRSVLKR